MTGTEPNTLTQSLVKRLARIDNLIGVTNPSSKRMGQLQRLASDTIHTLTLLGISVCSGCELPCMPQSNSACTEPLCESCEVEFRNQLREIANEA